MPDAYSALTHGLLAVNVDVTLPVASEMLLGATAQNGATFIQGNVRLPPVENVLDGYIYGPGDTLEGTLDAIEAFIWNVPPAVPVSRFSGGIFLTSEFATGILFRSRLE